jgi:hypothetical protein
MEVRQRSPLRMLMARDGVRLLHPQPSEYGRFVNRVREALKACWFEVHP